MWVYRAENFLCAVETLRFRLSWGVSALVGVVWCDGMLSAQHTYMNTHIQNQGCSDDAWCMGEWQACLGFVTFDSELVFSHAIF